MIGAAQWFLSPAGVKAWSRAIPGLMHRLSRTAQHDIRKVRRLGVLRADGMGDLVLTFGFLSELRKQLPDTEITLICQQQWAPWMRDCPWLDDVIGVEISPLAELSAVHRSRALIDFMKKAWDHDLEMVLNPGTLFEYAPSRALSWFSGAPVRICWEDPRGGRDSGGSFNTRTLEFPFELHETEKCRLMLEAVGLEAGSVSATPWWTPADRERGAQAARTARGDRHVLVALGMAASERAKRWPATQFLEIARQLRKSHDAAFLALGGPDVASDTEWLSQSDSGITSLARAGLSIGATWSAIANCDLYIGNDTGITHLAAATGIPVIVVIGIPEGAPPGTRGDSQSCPSGPNVRIVRPRRLSASGFLIDVSSVEAEAVLATALSVMQQSQGSSPLGP